MVTELSRYNLGVTFFETLIARSYLINFSVDSCGLHSLFVILS